MRAICLSFAALLLGAACTQFPEVDATVGRDTRTADYPALVPVETLQARMNSPTLTPAAAPAFDTRVAGLKARAAALKRRSVVDRATACALENPRCAAPRYPLHRHKHAKLER